MDSTFEVTAAESVALQALADCFQEAALVVVPRLRILGLCIELEDSEPAGLESGDLERDHDDAPHRGAVEASSRARQSPVQFAALLGLRVDPASAIARLQ